MSGIFLLDANVLIALAWPEHEAHARAGNWFARHSRQGWATCPLTQAALVRILANPAFSPHSLTPQNALLVLQANIELPGHHFWPADISMPEACKIVSARPMGHRQWTDIYLVGLVVHRRGRLATLDRRIAKWAPHEALELIP